MRGSARRGLRRLGSLLVALTLSATVSASLHTGQTTLNARPLAASSFQPADVGAPSAAVLPNGSQLVFWKSPAGHLVESWYAGGVWNGPVDVTASYFGGAGLLQSAPHAVVTPGGSAQLVFWQGAAGHVIEAWWNGHWNGPVDWSAANAWSAPVTSAPTAAVTPGGTQLLFWQGPGGHLYEAWWDGHWHGPADWTAANGWGASLSSAPALAIAPDGAQVVFWEGAGGHLDEAWWDGRWNGPVDRTVAGGWAPLWSAPALAIAPDGTQVVFWQGPGGHLYEAWWDGHWNGAVDWTAAHGGGSTLVSAPTVAVTPDGSTQIVFWEGMGQSLGEAWYRGAWNGPVDYSPPPVCSATLPAGKVITVSLSQQTAVFYQGRCSVNSSLVTTGRPGLRTPAGAFHVFSRSAPAHFVSPWPRGSPDYYTPETTMWAVGYESGGYFLHDAPWEPQDAYGPSSENGPSASHGCIHVPTAVMQWLFSWAGNGTTVIVTS